MTRVSSADAQHRRHPLVVLRVGRSHDGTAAQLIRVPEKGDARWLDHQGSFMAIAAQPVFHLLGAKGLGRSDDYKSEKMPPVNVSLLDGQLARRQHDGGHTDASNWKYFIPWADRMLNRSRDQRSQ
jgi:hypothetical protein